MQDKVKIEIVNNLIRELGSGSMFYADEKQGFYFDYDTVIELLRKASNIMNSTSRCPKPKDVPSDIPWCESMNNEDFDPFVYKGDMSTEDFEKAQKKYLENKDEDNS